MRLFLSRIQAAEALGISTRHADRYIAQHNIRRVEINHQFFYLAREINKLARLRSASVKLKRNRQARIPGTT